MKCPKCQFQNPEDSQFCLECGGKIELKCPNCSKVLPIGARFCNGCGHDLRKPADYPPIDLNQPQSYTPKHLADKILTTRASIEGERKVVTVLFADVANFTSISEKLDPEDVHQIMDGCFKILMDEIHRFEGTINQFTGDGVMALFGAPIAHEDHAQRACHASLAIQTAIKPYAEKLKENLGIEFSIRIGINSGAVVVGSIGDDLRMDYTAQGDTSNLASRMESHAEPGTVLISENTYRLVRDFFELESKGKLQVKGKEAPVEAYQLVRAGEVETRIGASAAKGLTRFVGRKRELEGVKETFTKAQSGRGQVVGIVGEAGVGKSRLLLELKNMLPEGDYTYLEGRCLHYGGSMAYLPILDILRSYFDIKEGEGDSDIKEKIKKKTLRLDERLKTVFPPFQEILSLTVDDGAYLKVEPVEKRTRTFEAIRDLLVRLSENNPLVLAVEDLHWIDKTSEEFLDYMIGWLPNTRILLILLYRPEYTHTWGSKSYYSKIGVDHLSSDTSAELVRAILDGGDVMPELRDLILSRASGNPFFMEELTHSLLENGAILKKEDQYVLSTKPSDIQVPDTIQGIIAARMDRLEEGLKRIMQVASVIGREFAFRILHAITEMKEDLKSNLLNLQGLEFIYEKSLFPELEYIFRHALTQEVAYNSLLVKRRKEIHEKIAQAIEELYAERLEEFYEMLAYHYGRSDNTEKAVEYLDLANQKAVKLNAMEEAKTYFDEAMKLLDTLPDTEENQKRCISLLVNQWIVFLQLLKFKEYYELLTRYEPMAIGLGNQGLLGEFYAQLSQCGYWFSNFDQAIQMGTKALELCEAAGNVEGSHSAYNAMQYSYLYKGDYENVLALKEDILRMIEQQFNLHIYVWTLSAVSWAYSELGLWDEAVKEGQEGLRIAKEFSDNSLISFAAFIISLAYTFKGDLRKATEYAELAVQKAPTPADKAWAQMVLALAWCRAGESHRGVEILTALVQMSQDARYEGVETNLMLYLGEGYWLAREYDKATRTLKECLKFSERLGMKFYSGSAHRLLGELTLKTNPSQAATHFEQCIAIFGKIKAENELAKTYTGCGRFYKQQGNMTQAREYLTKALEIFERLGTLIEPDKLREELAGLPDG